MAPAAEGGVDDSCFKNLGALSLDGASAGLPAVLVLGGSTFMGRALVEALLARKARVCLVNRGRIYWGTDDPSGGRAARLQADRRDTEAFSARLSAVTDRLPGGSWDVVADFCAFDGRDIRAALAGLRGRFGVYAYISSDSAYEVCTWAAGGWQPRGSAEQVVAECEAVRPEDESARRRLGKADSYGDKKLEAEEALAAGLAEFPGSRGVALRLPDVIGPFDDTYRLWSYWHWLQAASSGKADPPQVMRLSRSPKRQRQEDDIKEIPLDPPLAFVYNRDVARFIVGLIGAQQPAAAKQFDAVNLGCLQQLPLPEFLNALASVSEVSGLLPFETSSRPRTFLPSVKRPWLLRCQHASDTYGFTPTPLEDVLKECAEWFSSACIEFPKEAKAATKRLPPKVRRVALNRLGASDAKSSSSSSSGSSSS